MALTHTSLTSLHQQAAAHAMLQSSLNAAINVNTTEKSPPSNRYCKDCKFSKLETTDVFWKIITFGRGDVTPRCTKILTDGISMDPVDVLVFGPKKIRRRLKDYRWCSGSRGVYSECGPDGKLWLPKRKKDLFKLLEQ